MHDDPDDPSAGPSRGPRPQSGGARLPAPRACRYGAVPSGSGAGLGRPNPRVRQGVIQTLQQPARPRRGHQACPVGHQGKPYALANHSLEGQVPREHLREAARGPGVDLATRAVRSVMAIMSLALEYEQATLARDASQYDAEHRVDVSSAPWSDAENGDPAGDIEAGKEAIRASVGI